MHFSTKSDGINPWQENTLQAPTTLKRGCPKDEMSSSLSGCSIEDRQDNNPSHSCRERTNSTLSTRELIQSLYYSLPDLLSAREIVATSSSMEGATSPRNKSSEADKDKEVTAHVVGNAGISSGEFADS